MKIKLTEIDTALYNKAIHHDGIMISDGQAYFKNGPEISEFRINRLVNHGLIQPVENKIYPGAPTQEYIAIPTNQCDIAEAS